MCALQDPNLLAEQEDLEILLPLRSSKQTEEIKKGRLEVRNHGESHTFLWSR
jgi:hypothetical protein